MKKIPIAVIGAGSWGTALGLLLARNGQEVRLWGHEREVMRSMQKHHENSRYLPDFPFPENIKVCVEIVDALDGVEDVLLVVPSHAFREVLVVIKALMKDKLRIVWGTKGLDPHSGLTLDSVAKELFGTTVPLAVLSGPSFATEVAKGLPTAVTLASVFDDFCKDLTIRFQSEVFRLYRSTDVVGVELCGVVKNVLAIAAGICDGLQMGANTRCAMITRGFAEMGRLLEAVGGQQQTLLSLAGFGDTILTCMSDQSRNRRFGLAVGAGAQIETAIKQIGQVVEGYYNAKQLHQYAQKFKVEMPIVEAIYQVLFHNKDPSAAARTLLQRDPSGRWG